MGQENMKIRIVSEQDAEALLKIYAPYVRDTAITFEFRAPSVEEFAGRIRETLKRYPYLAAEEDGRLLGYIYAGPFKARAAYDWAVETSIYVDCDVRRQGVGRRLHRALEEALKVQGILNMNACIASPCGAEDPYLNRDSVEFHSRLGYRLVGEFYQCGYKLGRWYNMVWMEKHIGEHKKHQPEVRPFPEIRELLPVL